MSNATSITQSVSPPATQPLLRWAGSKRGILPQLLARIPEDVNRYVEPFAGSACLFFALRPEKAILGDNNPELIFAYQVLADDAGGVAEMVRKWPQDRETYYRLRSVDPSLVDDRTRAARFIYLNRLCFNGVYRTNRRGQFNVPFGSRTGGIPSVEQFESCGEALANAELRCGDFESVLANVERDDLVYLDPPYSRALSDAYGVYGYGSFQGTDLDRFLQVLWAMDEVGAKVLVSYRASTALENLGPPWRAEQLSVTTQVGGTAQSRTTRRDLLLANYELPKKIGDG